MTENQIKVLKIDPDKAPYVKEIENTLQGLQSEIGGLIEVVPLDDGNLLLCNEEGKMNGMVPNRHLSPTFPSSAGHFRGSLRCTVLRFDTA